ncbi:MAG: hypothetical protein AAGA48_02275 [Myxococcota bacterium]
MHITLLNGVGSSPSSDRIAAAVGIRASRLTVHDLASPPFRPCDGCARCLVEHPGFCAHLGEVPSANRVLEDIMAADLVVIVTRPRFGVWDYAVKAMLDRALALGTPFIEGGIRQRRYDRYPRWAVFALGTQRAAGRSLFLRAARATASSVLPGGPWVRFIEPDVPLATLDALAGEALGSPARAAQPEPRETVSHWLVRRGVPRGTGPRHAVVWVGSGKPSRTSTSEALGRALAERLRARGWTFEVLPMTAPNADPDRFVASLQRADLVIPAAPVHHGTLPASVIQGLGVAVDEPSPERTAWLPIVQCGLPEVRHTTLAIEILQRAVGERGDAWVGHLAMGQGEALRGQSPDGRGVWGRELALALDAAADAVHAGQPLSDSIIERSARPLMPAMVYRAAHRAIWWWRAARLGTLDRLADQPFRTGLRDS